MFFMELKKTKRFFIFKLHLLYSKAFCMGNEAEKPEEKISTFAP